MSNYGFGSGPFSEDNGDLNSAIDAARKVMGGYKPDLPSTVTQQHVDDAALDVVNNAKTLQEKNSENLKKKLEVCNLRYVFLS